MADLRYRKGQMENLITLLAHDNVNGRIVARLIEPELFEGELRNVAERLVGYWRDYKEAPGYAHLNDVFADIIDDPTSRKAGTYKRILKNMAGLEGGINTEYVLKVLRTFSRVQRMKDAILKSAEKLNAQQELAIAEVEEMLGDLLRAREHEFDRGLRLSDIDRVIDFMESHFSEFRMGIPSFDRRDIVPARGAVMLLLAPAGYGKTWGLIHTGKHGLLQRKRVLHITLEMGEEEVMGRYYQQIFAIPKRHEDEVEISEITPKSGADMRLDEIGNFYAYKPEFYLSHPNVRKLLKKEMRHLTARHITENLIVKRFPPRALTMNGLRAYLDALEGSEGFIPDMLVLDYIGITQTDAKNHRISLGRVFEEFRGVCVERNMAGVTAHQVSKKGTESREVKVTHASEDWSLIGTTDIAITYSQTKAEHHVGLARLLVGKARSDEDKFAVVITQSYKVGQFALQSARLNKKFWQYVDQIVVPDSPDDEEDEEDDD